MRRLSRFRERRLGTIRDRVIAIAGIACVSALLSCGGSGDSTTAPSTPTYTLTTKSQLFSDLTKAFNRHDPAAYAKLLDHNFVFYLSAFDQTTGAEWDRATEVDYTSKLLDLDYDGSLQCDSVYFAFHYDLPYITYHVFTPASAPNESWYQTTLSCSFLFHFGLGVTFGSASNNTMTFVIRNAGTESAPVWKFVEIHDNGSPELGSGGKDGDVYLMSLGRVKALYAPQDSP